MILGIYIYSQKLYFACADSKINHTTHGKILYRILNTIK